MEGEGAIATRDEGDDEEKEGEGAESVAAPAALDPLPLALVRASPCCMIIRCSLRLLSRFRCTALLPHVWLQLLVLGLCPCCCCCCCCCCGCGGGGCDCEEGEAVLSEAVRARRVAEGGVGECAAAAAAAAAAALPSSAGEEADRSSGDIPCSDEDDKEDAGDDCVGVGEKAPGGDSGNACGESAAPSWSGP